MNIKQIHNRDYENKVEELTQWLETCPYDIDDILTYEMLCEKAMELADGARDDYFDMKHEEEIERKAGFND